jgi:hypothetical protein
MHAANEDDKAGLLVPAGQYVQDKPSGELYVPRGQTIQLPGEEFPVVKVYPPVQEYLAPFIQ